MPAQFIMNISIAILWVLFQDEDQFYVTTFATGYLVGAAILYLMHRFFGERFYLTRFFNAIKLVLIYLTELVKSSYEVIVQVINPKEKLRPGVFRYETRLRGEWEVPLLALLLILTPGSVVVEVTPEGDAFYVHAMNVSESKEQLLRSLDRFEKAIMGVTR